MFSLSSRLEKEECHPSGGQTRRQTSRLEHQVQVLVFHQSVGQGWGHWQGKSRVSGGAAEVLPQALCGQSAPVSRALWMEVPRPSGNAAVVSGTQQAGRNHRLLPNASLQQADQKGCWPHFHRLLFGNDFFWKVIGGKIIYQYSVLAPCSISV